MSTGFWILSGLMAIGALAFWHKMKVWSVALIGFNVMIATLFAIGLFEMVANILDGAMGVMAYYNDMIAFSLIFGIVLAILMVATSMISKVDLLFSKKTDDIAKWISVAVVVIGFSSVTTYVFYEVMPEKPKQSSVLPSMKLVDFVSGGSLAPLLNGSKWNTEQFVQDQMKRDAGVYTQTVSSDEPMSAWKFEGDSPNAK